MHTSRVNLFIELIEKLQGTSEGALQLLSKRYR